MTSTAHSLLHLFLMCAPSSWCIPLLACTPLHCPPFHVCTEQVAHCAPQFLPTPPPGFHSFPPSFACRLACKLGAQSKVVHKQHSAPLPCIPALCMSPSCW